MCSRVQNSGGGGVRRREHRKSAVAADEPEVDFLVMYQAQSAAVEAERAVVQGLVPEERVPEHHHHGPVGGGSQLDGRVATTPLQSGADEDPWVSALRLDEGVGEAATWLQVHVGHVDLSKVVSDSEVIARGWRSSRGKGVAESQTLGWWG